MAACKLHAAGLRSTDTRGSWCTALQGQQGIFLPSGHVPFGGSKVITAYTTPRAPTYSMRRMIYFSTVKAIAQMLFLNGSASSGIWPVLGSTPITSPVNKGITHTQRVIKSTAYVQKYMHTCAQSAGSPRFLVS